MKHEAMDIETVAELLGVSTRQVRTYIAQGMPSRKEGRTPVFVWREVFDWFLGYKMSLEYGDRPAFDDESAGDDTDDLPAVPTGKPNEDIRQATLRKTRAEADLRELALSRQRSEVITIADAKVRLDRMMGNLRTKLLSIPPKLASRLEGLKARTEREAAIKDEMETLCREISTGAVVDLPDNETSQGEMPHNESGLSPASAVDISASAELPTNVQILADLLNAEAYS